MAYEQTDALVLRIVEFSESSCIVSLLTRDFGKINVLAKGARRLKNPFDNSIDLLSICRATFVAKNRDALDILTEAKLLRRFRAANRDLNRLYSGYYVAELLNALTDEHDPEHKLFSLACATIEQVDGGSDDLLRSLLAFELRTLNLLGHLPSLSECADCGRPAPLQDRYFFALLNGGLLCRECRKLRKSVISISLGAREKLLALADLSVDPQRIELSNELRGELKSITHRYIAHLLGFNPRVESYIEHVK